MTTLILLPVAIVAGTALFSPSPIFAQSLPPIVKQKVEAAQKQVKMIGMEEYRKLVENPGAALIVDVREPHEYAAGHVPGAINIPRGLLEFKIWSHVGFPANTEMGRPVILQCQSGNRASLAAQSLQDLGFTQTTAVVMNLDDWQKAGNPFEK
jgi:rhodanese-related sulfurtransferase